MAKQRREMLAETRAKLIGAARRAFAEQGYAAAAMDELTAAVGLTRGALYHHFGGKEGLLAAVVEVVDGEMAGQAKAAAARCADPWEALLTEGTAYIEMALDPEVQRIVLLDGPAVLGDPSRWPSQNSCLAETRHAVADMLARGLMRPVDADVAARLLSGAALNAALWVAASEHPAAALPKAVAAFRLMAAGLRADA